MEVRPQETDFDFLVWDVEAAGVPMPLAPYAQTNRLHHITGLGVFRVVPIRPKLSVVDEPGEAVLYTTVSVYELDVMGGVSQVCAISRTRCSEKRSRRMHVLRVAEIWAQC